MPDQSSLFGSDSVPSPQKNTTLSGLQSGPAGSPAAVPDLSARQAQRPAEPVLHVEALAVGPHAAITDVTPTTGWAAPQGQQNRQSPFHVIARNAAGAAVALGPTYFAGR